MALAQVSLDDKYALDATRAYLTGIEALVRLPILQHQRDREAGLNTAGFISGYRGSPLGGVDQAMWKAGTWLDKHNIHFQPGINEDLAATAVWGSQQVNVFPGAKYDGVFGMWYGKGPGVDRSMDVMRHANAFGTSKYGGVLAVASDDHACKSSTLPHQTEHMFIGASMPVLSPANVQEVLDLGIFGWELSRYSGCWVSLKAITENMDSAISAEIDPHRVNIVIPENFQLPEDGLHARWPDNPLEQERRLNKFKIYAARNFAYANKLNQVKIDSPEPRLGIITTGKSYLDVRQALDDLGIDEREAARIGLRVFKLGMSWPLEPIATHEFASGLEEILVVEEKRSIVEDQLTGQLYNWPVDDRPRVIGEFDEHGNDLLPNLGELTPAMIARAICSRIRKFYTSKTIEERLAFLQAKEQRLEEPRKVLTRQPHFCSGCPHNTSTKVPEGSVAFAGIGCHYMAQWMDSSTFTFTQMGGEGATWIGQAPFTYTKHVFQNLGDGTYFHSGILAIRAAIASGVNITYKILYNDAVAMTGGQAIDGSLSVEQIVYQLRGEGIKRIAIVSDQSDKYPASFPRFEGLSFDDRKQLDNVQKELRELDGTTIIIYDQTCAAEKRRRRKKKLMPDPARRVFINEEVCEGCGDCRVKSNCLSILPKETELGRKREIDQSACNKDFSCLDGFCPSFVSVIGEKLRKNQLAKESTDFMPLPDPELPELSQPWNVLIGGVGGTGVLTVSSVLAMAAHIEGKGCATLNQTGLAQKFGSVISHVRIGTKQDDIHAVRIAAGDADLLLGCDLVVSASDEALAKLHVQRSNSIVNDNFSPTAEFLSNPDAVFPAAEMKRSIEVETGAPQKTHFVRATDIATALMGDSIAANLFLLGFAWQSGLIPVSTEAIDEAIILNNVAISFNQQAFMWGRRTAVNPGPVMALAKLNESGDEKVPENIIEDRTHRLRSYQNNSYADDYADFLRQIEHSLSERKTIDKNEKDHLLTQIAKNLYKLMAYKDEYEVARLYSNGKFRKQLEQKFEGKYRLQFHLAPPVLASTNKDKIPQKREFGQWTMTLFRALAKLKFLRGTRFNFFGYSDERRLEKQLPLDYKKSLSSLVERLDKDNYELALEIVCLPEIIRGYGHVKLANIEKAERQKQILHRKFFEAKKNLPRKIELLP
ncbi:MAG: indolepyruvate ferredoxin oxidoreductase family protein [Gammaproteobacteria bacterium]|nr:indolepyruvate ferredoxin oxidoreductase family protein [Gammaproteobacteria bacterium]